jgi:hypothetical protein
MIKTLIITFLILYVVYKLTGFLVRTILRNAGISFTNGRSVYGAGGAQGQSGPDGRHATNQSTGFGKNKADPKPNITDGVGDYVEFEEVK